MNNARLTHNVCTIRAFSSDTPRGRLRRGFRLAEADFSIREKETSEEKREWPKCVKDSGVRALPPIITYN